MAADLKGDPKPLAASLLPSGAPVVFLVARDSVQWWEQAVQGPRLRSDVSLSNLSRFFSEQAADLAPERVYRAKTWGAFQSSYQLDFVDVGLMPLVDAEIGRKLGELVERMIERIGTHFPNRPTEPFGQWLFQASFWLLAAKILKDKDVSAFRSLDLTAPADVFKEVSRHYRAQSSPEPGGQREQEALEDAASTLARFSSLRHVTTESLAYVYENTLVSKATRRALGTHSTPSYLVDYVLGRLRPWIEEIPEANRQVFEPAAGHAAFLVASIRLLRDLLPASMSPADRGTYLRRRLHGVEVDAFAVEIARLSLTLADVPNPNGWDLRAEDMFARDALEKMAAQCSVLLTNPPFEHFSSSERTRYARLGRPLVQLSKTAEVLGRTLPHLRPGAVFGVVIPQGLLHSRHARDLRQTIVNGFELAEICLFSDRMFAFSDMESAIVLGRRIERKPAANFRYRRVRESAAERFRKSYEVTAETLVAQATIEPPTFELRLPELAEVWAWCRRYPTLGELANIGQGLSYEGRDLPPGAVTISKQRFAGAVQGYATIHAGLLIHEQPHGVWMSVDTSVLSRARSGTARQPQVLLNYARVSRGPWRLKAIIDPEGHVVTNRFLAVRPKDPAWPLEFFWALCNSPIANAYVFAHSMKRDVLVGDMRALPTPQLALPDAQRVTVAAIAYLEAAGARRPPQALPTSTDPNQLHTLLLRLDAEVLRLYDLPPRLERQLLDTFSGYQRAGVAFPFAEYYPHDFEPYIPLALYISPAFQRSTSDKLVTEVQKGVPSTLSAALAAAVEAFEE